MNLIKIESNLPTDLLRIELFLSDICNYKCWYCFPGSNEGTIPWPKTEQLIDNLSHLIDHYILKLGKKNITLHIIGGEPTYWKDFGKFSRYFKTMYNCAISISTNGSRDISWWNTYGGYLDHVMLSCHHERIDVDHIKKVGDLLYNKHVWVNALVLMDPTQWNKCTDIVDELKTSKKSWTITPIEVYANGIEYTYTQKKYISNSLKRFPNLWYYFRYKKTTYKKSTIEFSNGKHKKVNSNWISLNNLNHFKDWECNLGVDTLHINKDGSIGGACGETLYNLNYKFNIYDENFIENFNIELAPTICKQTGCFCSPEINTTKRVIPLIKV